MVLTRLLLQGLLTRNSHHYIVCFNLALILFCGLQLALTYSHLMVPVLVQTSLMMAMVSQTSLRRQTLAPFLESLHGHKCLAGLEHVGGLNVFLIGLTLRWRQRR